MLLNRINKEVLKENLQKETFSRRTLSLYRYVTIDNPIDFRNTLFKEWFGLQCFGRIYVAHEGINAQMSVPEFNLPSFLDALQQHNELAGVPIKYAIEDNGKSFYKLTIKVRPKIVADGLDEGSYNLSRVGTHLAPLDFHKAIEEDGTMVVDMRNHYESEIGRFVKAYCPDADTFKDAIQMVAKEFGEKKDTKILLYCTGGIRCEKASSYLIHHGFTNVFQLEGGIVEYGQQIKAHQLPSRFIGKNFVFDERLGETVDGQVISSCHQCGQSCDTHTNCSNSDCHMLFIQCPACKEKYNGCCSEDCQHILSLPAEERKRFRVIRHGKYSKSKIFNNNLKKYTSTT
jgi:UPF0176 protein